MKKRPHRAEFITALPALRGAGAIGRKLAMRPVAGEIGWNDDLDTARLGDAESLKRAMIPDGLLAYDIVLLQQPELIDCNGCPGQKLNKSRRDLHQPDRERHQRTRVLGPLANFSQDLAEGEDGGSAKLIFHTGSGPAGKRGLDR